LSLFFPRKNTPEALSTANGSGVTRSMNRTQNSRAFNAFPALTDRKRERPAWSTVQETW